MVFDNNKLLYLRPQKLFFMTISDHIIYIVFLCYIIKSNFWYETYKSCPAADDIAVVAAPDVATSAAVAAAVAAVAVDNDAAAAAAAAAADSAFYSAAAADATAVFDRSHRSYLWISPNRLCCGQKPCLVILIIISII